MELPLAAGSTGPRNPAAKNGKDCNGIFVCSNSGPLSPASAPSPPALPQIVRDSINRNGSSFAQQFAGEGPKWMHADIRTATYFGFLWQT